ncbi:MAG TPA: ABC transporter ATP-binding protein [Stellaceae bacterium]|jgi:branched-chain amino acid transport system ATP-binding protein|nr:ABC transporter ATP-binding protein [Stellaceae bacterium]
MKLLEVSGLSVFYGDLQALFDIGIAVEPGQTVALIGANGAGKTTFLKSVAGLIASKRGGIVFDGRDITGDPAERIAQLGMALVPEGRLLFQNMTIEENLIMGGYTGRKGYWTLAKVYELFPAIASRGREMPFVLSGGEQQMVAIGRALMANPRLLLADEISQGLAPVVVDQIYKSFPAIRADGTSIIIVEQEVKRAAAASDYTYCLLKGRVTLEGRSRELSFDALSHAYFGT